MSNGVKLKLTFTDEHSIWGIHPCFDALNPNSWENWFPGHPGNRTPEKVTYYPDSSTCYDSTVINYLELISHVITGFRWGNFRYMVEGATINLFIYDVPQVMLFLKLLRAPIEDTRFVKSFVYLCQSGVIYPEAFVLACIGNYLAKDCFCFAPDNNVHAVCRPHDIPMNPYHNFIKTQEELKDIPIQPHEAAAFHMDHFRISRPNTEVALFGTNPKVQTKRFVSKYYYELNNKPLEEVRECLIRSKPSS